MAILPKMPAEPVHRIWSMPSPRAARHGAAAMRAISGAARGSRRNGACLRAAGHDGRRRCPSPQPPHRSCHRLIAEFH